MTSSATVSKGKRFNEIFHILFAHDFTGLLRDLASYARDRTVPLAGNGAAPSTLPFRIRRLMEDLGPTFIKMGQLLGTRPDLIPAPFIEEFKKLYDQTTPTPFPQIKEVLEAELGRRVEDVFASFDETAIASASIGQVHRAVLKTGEAVAVKVQHPNIQARMKTDFDLLGILVRFTERVFAATRVLQPAEHLEEIRGMLDRELDYRNEARIQRLVEENFKDVPEVKIPHLYDAHCTKAVLVMEYVQGLKVVTPAQPELRALDRKNVARIITHAMAKQVFVDRLFHADPSPGNILVMGSNRVCFLDFGAFGVVTRRRSRIILEFLLGLGRGNVDEVARAVVELCDVRAEYDHRRFLRDVERISDYYERTKASPADPVLLQMLIETANEHRMVLPPDFMLITRALYQFDGVCKALDPDFELVEALGPYVSGVVKERLFDAEAQVENLRKATTDFVQLAARLPGHLEKFFYKLDKGELGLQVEMRGLAEYKAHQMRLGFIFAFTVLVGFVLVAGALAYGLGGVGMGKDFAFFAVMLVLAWCLVFVYASGLFRRSKL